MNLSQVQRTNSLEGEVYDISLIVQAIYGEASWRVGGWHGWSLLHYAFISEVAVDYI
jgi:hypothetical protein